jgi:hypothetical protein
VRVVSRGNTARLTARSVVAAAAYNAREELYDERLHEKHNYAHRSADLVESDVLLPPLAPYRWFDREVLWNEVEARERRSDAQLARSVILTLPRELDPAAGADLAREFFGRAFVDRGMIADVAVHTKTASDGGPQPHAHALLTMRRIVDGAFALKERAWNGVGVLNEWREQWADMANRHLAAHGISARLDHRPVRSAVRVATERVAEAATLARAAAIIGAAVTTQVVRDAARRLRPKHARRGAVPLDATPPKTPIEQLREELRRPLRTAAVGVAAGAWSYAEAVDGLVADHLLPAIRRFPELEPRFEAIEGGIGSALAKGVERVEKQISGNAAILQERAEQRERVMAGNDRGFTQRDQADGLVTTQAMRDMARRMGQVGPRQADVGAERAQQASRRAQQEAATHTHELAQG